MTKSISRSFVERYAPRRKDGALAPGRDVDCSARVYGNARNDGTSITLPVSPPPAPPVIPADVREQGEVVAWLHEELPEVCCITDKMKQRWLLTYDGPDAPNEMCQLAVLYSIPVYR